MFFSFKRAQFSNSQASLPVDSNTDILGITLDLVKARLHRARQALRRELESGCDFHRDECDGLACDRKPSIIVFRRPR